LTVRELAAQFPDLVESGISKHLMGLRAAHLVTATKVGRTQRYRLDVAMFSVALAPWLARYEPYFADALTRLQTLAESGASTRTSLDQHLVRGRGQRVPGRTPGGSDRRGHWLTFPALAGGR
jgi:hypothetical protein